MGLRINNNLEAQNALRQLNINQMSFSKSMQRLSSGKRINSAADDAAGYAISNKLQAQTKGLDQASANAQDGISLIQTAAGGLQTTVDLLQRFRQLAVQSSNDTNTAADRTNLQDEGNAIANEITQISNTTQFNGQKLLDGNYSSKVFQVGANAGESLSVSVSAMDASTLGVATGSAATTAGGNATVTAGLDISTTQSAASSAITTIDAAIKTVTDQSSKLGATQNRLSAAMSNLAISSENQQAAYSNITNVNMAQESTSLATAQILQQSATAMLAQANQAPQSVLKLLG